MSIRLGIYIVSTRNYINLLDTIIGDIYRVFKNTEDVKLTINIATDNPRNLLKKIEKFDSVSFKVLEIPNYGWPEATLFRYKIMKQFNNFFDYDFCMYIDCDMRIHQNFLMNQNILKSDKLNVVLHPSYNMDWSILGICNALMSKSYWKMIIRNLLSKSFKPGAWETNEKSLAFLDYKSRKKYVHGAIWLGNAEIFESLCSTLIVNIDKDLENKIIAVWHDESHLNWYASTCEVNYLGMEFSWVSNYRHLKHISPIVSSLSVEDKNRFLLLP